MKIYDVSELRYCAIHLLERGIENLSHDGNLFESNTSSAVYRPFTIKHLNVRTVITTAVGHLLFAVDLVLCRSSEVVVQSLRLMTRSRLIGAIGSGFSKQLLKNLTLTRSPIFV